VPASLGSAVLERETPDSPRTRFCTICGRVVLHQEVYRKWGYPILRCSGCGVGIADVGPGFESKFLYDEGYFSGGKVDGYADYEASETVLRGEFAQVVGALREVGPSSGRLLELGCAFGFFLDEAAPYYEVAGLELCSKAVASCRQRGHSVDQGELNAAWLRERPKFDAVVMLDVIEHLPDPSQTIGLIAEALRPGGCLLLTTGDWASLVSRLTGRHWRLMTPPQHLYYFTLAALSRLLRKHGLEIVQARRPWKWVPLSLILFQLGRMLGRRPAAWPALSRLGVPVNLFDAVRVIARRTV
jgi:2-polyprenyl-3-methyl-5-hydroxy-6-metoxy-1,4-benzoquinol methylase